MDNLTHSLVGALLGQLGLKRATGLAMPTLIIAANLPDIDAVASVLGTESLAIRRGLTHGPIALVLLPFALTAIMLAWHRWRPRADRPPVRPTMILLLAAIGTISHPALDWVNSYGVRLLEPFSSRWFAGDTIFIIDLWLWIALILGVGFSRRRERSASDGRRPAVAAFAAICAYIFANGMITGRAEAAAHDALAERKITPTLVVANPMPIAFWSREMLWRDATVHGSGRFGLSEGVRLDPKATPLHLDDPRLAAARARDPAVRAFLFWSRMPMVVEGEAGKAFLTDQRFSNGLVRGRFSVPL